MLKQLRKRNQGFTIIEVMIVLAIAGLILLIVFLAVPALQRNSRNTQRRNDVAQILGAVSEYTNNNNGTLPGGSGVQFADSTNPTVTGAFTNASPNLGYYKTPANILWTYKSTPYAANSVPTGPSGSTQLDAVSVYNYLTCASNGQAAQITGATTRSIVAIYYVETSSGTPLEQCQQS